MKILLFVSSNCPHCPNAEKVAKKVAYEYHKKGLSFKKVRMKTSEGKELGAKYNIMANPTTLFLDEDDNEIQRITGTPDEDSFRKKIEKNFEPKKSLFKRLFS